MPATFTVPRRRLLDAVKTTTHIVPKRAERPILQTVRLSVNGRVDLFATNLEQTLLLPIEAAAEGEAAILVSPTQLQKSLTKLQGSEVTLRIEQDQKLTVIADGAELTIAAEHKAADYPSFGFDETQPRTVLARRDLLNSLRQTIFCCDSESSRYALGGVLFELSKEKLILCATDTRRLAVIEIPCANAEKHTCEGVVPLTACKALLKQLTEDTHDVPGAIVGLYCQCAKEHRFTVGLLQGYTTIRVMAALQVGGDLPPETLWNNPEEPR